MRKKLVIVILLVAAVLLVACEKEYEPDPAVREFLNNGMTAEKAYARIATAAYTEIRTISDKQGTIKGSFCSEIFMDKSDEDNLSLTIHSVYEGECVEDDKVVEMTSTLVKEEGDYKYRVSKTFDGNAELQVTVETMQAEDARNLISAIIYQDNGAYSAGLYYGDLFMLRIFRFPAESFFVDTEQNRCVFDEIMLFKEYYDLEDVTLRQRTEINELGLLMYNKEVYEATKSDHVLTSEITPSYTYLPIE